jgi:cytochrome P450
MLLGNCAAADERWKAIRKAVAVSFSAQNIKRKFPMILERVNEVVRRSAKLGPKASIDVVSRHAAVH